MRTESSISHAELVMHDVRLRILHAASLEPMTTKALAQKLPDIPQATLYRHVKILVEHGALESVSERTVKGIVESTYQTRSGAARLTREEFAALAPEEHRRIFALWLGELKTASDEYFAQPTYDTTTEGMTYFMENLSLTDGQRRQLRLDIFELLRRYAIDPKEGSRPTFVGVALLPEAVA